MFIRTGFTLILIIFIVAGNLGAAVIDSENVWLGVEFPYVREILTDSLPDLLMRNAVYENGGIKSWLWLQPTDSLPYTVFPVEGDLLFYLSDSGQVDSLKVVRAGMRDFISRFKNSLAKLKFQPAVYRGERIPFILPAHLLIKPPRGGFPAILTFPYDPRISYRNRRLVEEGLRENGFTLPGVKYFPPYFCMFNLKERLGDYPYAVFEIALDSSGHPSNVIEYCRTHRNFSSTISRVMLNAEFSPATYMGKKIPSRFYILFRFFENLRYPTFGWPPDTFDSTRLFPFEYLRIDNLLFPDSILNPPIPENAPGGLFWRKKIFSIADSIRVLVRIDTLGKIISSNPAYPMYPDMKSELDSLLAKLVFTPARDIWGARVAFNGELRLRFRFSEIIRIETLWWPPEAQPRTMLTY
ncbi:hypothetical protein TRIP_C60407 [Candidatus Zixiibacteriota bacterium]|nr:hypothetical protein TRIP_C60407 [candidate division Zixibacteria bacterium]